MSIWYYKARIYDPEAGRFYQTDPIDVAGGINLYAYVGNDPVNWTDPLGLVGGKWVASPCGRTDGTCPEDIVVTGERLRGITGNAAALVGGISGGTGAVGGGDQAGHGGSGQGEGEGEEAVVTAPVNCGLHPTDPRCSYKLAQLGGLPRYEQCIKFAHECLSQPGDSRELMKRCQDAEKVCNRRTFERRSNPANDIPPLQFFELCERDVCFSVDTLGRVRVYNKRFIR